MGLVAAICGLLVAGVLLTMPYAGWISAHLIGTYARATDDAAYPRVR